MHLHAEIYLCYLSRYNNFLQVLFEIYESKFQDHKNEEFISPWISLFKKRKE